MSSPTQIVQSLREPNAKPVVLLREPVLKAIAQLDRTHPQKNGYLRLPVVVAVEKLLKVKAEEFGQYSNGNLKFRNWVQECLYFHRRNDNLASPVDRHFVLTTIGKRAARQIKFVVKSTPKDSVPVGTFSSQILEAIETLKEDPSLEEGPFTNYVQSLFSTVKETMEPWGQSETITPARAAQLMEFNSHNRGIRKARRDRYTREMKNGTWKNTGQGLILSPTLPDGRRRLLNGQHTLQAIIASETTQRMLVVYDVPLENFSLLDRGKERDLSDVLSAAGVKYSKDLSILYSKKEEIQGSFGKIPDYRGSRMFSRTRRSLLHTDTAILWAGENYDVCREAVALIPDRGLLLKPASTFRSLYLLFRDVDKKAAEKFFRILVRAHGYGKNPETHPIYRLRFSLEKLAAERKTVKGARTSMARQVGLTIKAWNAWRTGKTYKSLRFLQGEKIQPIHGLKTP